MLCLGTHRNMMLQYMTQTLQDPPLCSSIDLKEGPATPGGRVLSIDQIAIKTPTPKCRLYWCLIEFIDWRYSQSCGCFDPSCKLAPLYLLSSSPPSPPLPCVNKYRTIHYIQCVTGGGGIGLCGEHIQE
jgi:hypothetical protein